MAKSKGPIPSVSFSHTPNHSSFTITFIINISSLKVRSIRPIELTFSIEPIINPFPFVGLPRGPNIDPKTFHFPKVKVSRVLLSKIFTMCSFQNKRGIENESSLNRELYFGTRIVLFHQLFHNHFLSILTNRRFLHRLNFDIFALDFKNTLKIL